MAEQSIRMKDAEVRAVLEGLKTQLRKPMNPQAPDNFYPTIGHYHPLRIDRHGEEYPAKETYGAYDDQDDFPCPLGAPGDHLWVREPWRVVSSGRHYPSQRTTIYVDWKAGRLPGSFAGQTQSAFVCSDSESDALIASAYGRGKTCGDKIRWRSSVHMPRWASRLTLRITRVRLERLQDISEEDAEREGFVAETIGYMQDANEEVPMVASARGQFKTSINNHEWIANPWVWVIDFEVVRRV